MVMARPGTNGNLVRNVSMRRVVENSDAAHVSLASYSNLSVEVTLLYHLVAPPCRYY